MEIGFALPVSGSWATPDNILHVARRAEELGYSSLWTFQRLLSDVDAALDVYRSVQDPLMTLAYVASATSRARLGVAVINVPFLSPTLLAKQAATLDVLSGGRLDLGLGLGWSEVEYAASGATTSHRGRRSEEFVAALKTLWTDDVVEHHGEFYDIPRSRLEPKPVQRPHPPIVLGGGAPAALRRAGRIADGWVSASRADLTRFGESVEIIRRAAVEAGRDPASLRFVCRGAFHIGDEADRPLAGPIDKIRRDIVDLSEQGMTELFVDLNFDARIGSPDADPAESLRRAEEALDAFAPPL